MTGNNNIIVVEGRELINTQNKINKNFAPCGRLYNGHIFFVLKCKGNTTESNMFPSGVLKGPIAHGYVLVPLEYPCIFRSIQVKVNSDFWYIMQV